MAIGWTTAVIQKICRHPAIQNGLTKTLSSTLVETHNARPTSQLTISAIADDMYCQDNPKVCCTPTDGNYDLVRSPTILAVPGPRNNMTEMTPKISKRISPVSLIVYKTLLNYI